MERGTLAGYPVKDVEVRLYDGQHHSVDSSEMAFRICGSMAFKQAMAEADPVLLEPIVKLRITVSEEHVGDVIGDLSARRGHPLGMEPRGSLTEISAEVPMAEVLDYAPDLRAMTGGRGDYTLELDRYDPVPDQLVAKVVVAAGGERSAA
jgi:elongation factor G